MVMKWKCKFYNEFLLIENAKNFNMVHVSQNIRVIALNLVRQVLDYETIAVRIFAFSLVSISSALIVYLFIYLIN
jgi:hypothetical protein